MHGGKSPQALRKAQERMLADIDEAVIELMRIALSGKSEAVRMTALREWFERSGFGEKKRVEITHINDDVLQQEYERLLAEMAELDN